MYESPRPGEHRRPKHTHYVSLSNGLVYPALRNLPGYEDDNPSDWRAANEAEIEAYKKGKQVPVQAPEQAVDLAAQPPVKAAPATIKLAEDETPEGAEAGDPPPLPADALGAIAPAPAPAFQSKAK